MSRSFFCLMLTVCLLANQTALGVVIDGKDWMQVTETTGFTYNEAASACDVNTGLCSGNIVRGANVLNVDGWTWAGNADMASMFAVITSQSESLFTIPAPGGNPNYFASSPAAWAEDFIDTDGTGPDAGLFDLTLFIDQNNFGVYGLTRTLFAGNTDRSYLRVGNNSSNVVIGNPHGFDTSRSHTGLWFYRSVPAPASIFLFAIGLVVAGARRWTAV